MATTTDFTATASRRRSSYFAGCMSPSCVPVHEEYTRINSSRRGGGDGRDRRSRKWRKLMNKVVEESKKSIYRSPDPITFRYDAVSYLQNFDEGNHCEEYYLYRSQFSRVSRECSLNQLSRSHLVQ